MDQNELEKTWRKWRRGKSQQEVDAMLERLRPILEGDKNAQDRRARARACNTEERRLIADLLNIIERNPSHRETAKALFPEDVCHQCPDPCVHGARLHRAD